ncbi:girdin-like isoform X2 [Dendronephthya gigantea]|uniref:girdin-like isoform X2 n=1 Tax=Dendronephthya gigantea TaxID=151771 RepID=UPI00106AE530|nr:girdin-like isoform X2 [Dendronephthya gigantea]
MSRFGVRKMSRKLRQSVRTACKFRYIVTYEYLEVKSQEDWKPTELNILWFRGHRTKSSIKPSWNVQVPNTVTKTSTCTAKWLPPYSVELIVTLYKDMAGSSFKKKDYMFVMEDIQGSKRKKLAIFPCNIASYVSMDGETHDLELEFKSLSKKIITAKCGLKIKCEFIKEGSAIDDDMQSNFSHMSEAEEFSRMSELAEVSEDEYSNSCEDIPEEVNELDVDEKVDIEPWQWQGLDFTRADLENQENSVDQNTAKGKSEKGKPWSKFVADINSFEWLRNPLSGKDGKEKKKRIAEQLKENAKEQTKVADESELPVPQDKQLIKAKSLSHEDERNEVTIPREDEDAVSDVFDNDEEEDIDQFRGSTGSLDNIKSRNGLRSSIKETLKNVTSKTSKLSSLGQSTDEWKELEAKLKEKTSQVWNLEHEKKDLTRDNRELVVENNKLQDDVFALQKQREEMQTEISELQILVEDLKIRLCTSEAEHKQLKNEERELLAKMNLRGWLCKRGVKGLTGHQWRRRWFATDESGKLYYYKQSSNSSPQGFIDLDMIIEVQDQTEEKQDKNKASFNVVVDKRKYELMAKDSEEKQKWINALDYLRHWRSHTSKFLSDDQSFDKGDALNPFLN